MWRQLVILIAVLFPFCIHAGIASPSTQQNVPIELTLTSTKAHSDPGNDLKVNVVFTQPDGITKTVPAFWDGSNIWKVRYASALVGIHTWKSTCSDPSESGLHNIARKITVTRYLGNNPLFRHGPIQVAPDKRHFEHADGTPFFWLGDTWWMGLCHRLKFPSEFQTLANNRKEKGFNVIQLVAGLYPDMHPFDPRGANEAGFPWETNYARLRPEYFDAADKRLRYLIDKGFTPCIVGAWGYFLPWMGEEKAKQHWRELIARYGSWPVAWCIAGEANLPWYLTKGFPYDDRGLVKGWTHVARYVKETDPFHRMITIHPTGIGKLNARWAIDNASLLDFDMLQTPHGERDAVPPTIAAFQHAYNLPPAMPILNGEASYENLNGKIPAEWPRAMFWLCMINGAAGHTYGANGIWQCNRRDEPHGASPHGGNYGTIPWDEAMNLPGSGQLGYAKSFLEKFPWHQCVPQPETVQKQSTPARVWGNWIWYPEGDSRIDAPLEPCFFRRSFTVTNKVEIQKAVINLSADDKAEAWLNGKKIGEVSDWRTGGEFDITQLLREGENLLAVQAENLKAPASQNPAGLNATIRLITARDQKVIVSDSEWRAAKMGGGNWKEIGFTDTDWLPAKVIAPYGEGPWGKLDQLNGSIPPFALGIEDQLKIVYSLSPESITVTGLRPKSRYTLTNFDPVTGQSEESSITTTATGTWSNKTPTHGHDQAFALKIRE